MPDFAPDRVTFMELPAGEAGVDATLGVMGQAVKAARRDYGVRRVALALVEHLPPKDYVGQARALHEFVRDRIRYVRDPVDQELVQTPQATLRIAQGDCDDKSVLMASLLHAIGHPARFVAIAVGDDPRFSHVYVETRIGDRWVASETTEPWPFGAFAKRITRRKVWHL